MIKNVDNEDKHGNSLEVILEDQDDVVSMMVNGYEVVVRYNDVGISIDVYDDTPVEGYKMVSEKQYWFENLSNKASKPMGTLG